MTHVAKFRLSLLHVIAQDSVEHTYFSCSVDFLGAATIQERPLLARVRYSVR